MSRHRILLGLVLAAGLCGCLESSVVPKCASGEMRFAGRPPERLFSYDHTCRADCFSSPSEPCKAASCAPVQVTKPLGQLSAGASLCKASTCDRELLLGDFWTLGQNHALIFGFRFADDREAGAPDDWGFLASGPATYLAGQQRASARFEMDTGVFNLNLDPTALPESDFQRVATPVGEVLSSSTGRLELTLVDNTHLAGRFYLFYETASEQPQGEVLGCFDLPVRAAKTAPGAVWYLGL